MTTIAAQSLGVKSEDLLRDLVNYHKRHEIPESILPTTALRNIEAMEYLFSGGKGNTGETAWDALNGVAEWCDHHQRSTGKDGTSRKVERQFLSVNPIKQHAFNAITEMTPNLAAMLAA